MDAHYSAWAPPYPHPPQLLQRRGVTGAITSSPLRTCSRHPRRWSCCHALPLALPLSLPLSLPPPLSFSLALPLSQSLRPRPPLACPVPAPVRIPAPTLQVELLRWVAALSPKPNMAARPRPPGSPGGDGEASTGGALQRQAIANTAAAGGDDGELHVDEAEHVPWQVVSPARKPPPPPGPGGDE